MRSIPLIAVRLLRVIFVGLAARAASSKRDPKTLSHVDRFHVVFKVFSCEGVSKFSSPPGNLNLPNTTTCQLKVSTRRAEHRSPRDDLDLSGGNICVVF